MFTICDWSEPEAKAKKTKDCWAEEPVSKAVLSAGYVLATKQGYKWRVTFRRSCEIPQKQLRQMHIDRVKGA